MTDPQIVAAYEAMLALDFPWATPEKLRQAAEFAAEMHNNPTDPTIDELRVQARWLRQIIGPPPSPSGNHPGTTRSLTERGDQ
jgi:hypothetical protein